MVSFGLIQIRTPPPQTNRINHGLLFLLDTNSEAAPPPDTHRQTDRINHGLFWLDTNLGPPTNKQTESIMVCFGLIQI